MTRTATEPIEETPPASLLEDVKRILVWVREILGPRRQEVRAEWRRKLEALGVGPDELAALSAVELLIETEAGSTDFEDLERDLERQGESLSRQGIPQERVLTALFLYLECCLPFVLGGRRRPAELAAALVRLTAVSSRAIRVGYDHTRRTSWRSFDERERHRLSRDLHDEIGHQLIVLKLYLELIDKDLPKRSTETHRKLMEALSLVAQALQSVRRLILDLGPAVLEEVGLLAAVRMYARQFTARTGVNVDVRDAGLPARLPASHETALYRVLQGALSNVLKHAQARNVRITLGSVKGAVIILVIEDDGIGFDPSLPRQAFGLAAMRERIESLGGRFHLEARPMTAGRRKGTRIEIDIPYKPGETS